MKLECTANATRFLKRKWFVQVTAANMDGSTQDKNSGQKVYNIFPKILGKDSMIKNFKGVYEHFLSFITFLLATIWKQNWTSPPSLLCASMAAKQDWKVDKNAVDFANDKMLEIETQAMFKL